MTNKLTKKSPTTAKNRKLTEEEKIKMFPVDCYSRVV